MLKRFNEIRKEVKKANQDKPAYVINYIASMLLKEKEVEYTLRDDLSKKEIYGISKEEIIDYVKYIYKNSLPTTKTLINLRYLMRETNYMPSLRINVGKLDCTWYVTDILVKKEYSKSFISLVK